jgi:hypothetical protein
MAQLRGLLVAMGRHPAPVPGMTAVRRNPAVRAGYVCFPAISAASPSAADTAVRWPGGQYLTQLGHSASMGTGEAEAVMGGL